MSHTPEHYQACIQDSQDTIGRLQRQLAQMGIRQRGRKYLHDRIACESHIITLLQRDLAHVEGQGRAICQE